MGCMWFCYKAAARDFRERLRKFRRGSCCVIRWVGSLGFRVFSFLNWDQFSGLILEHVKLVLELACI